MEDVLEIRETMFQEPDPPIKKLYNGLYADKKYTKSFDEFRKQYSTQEAIDKLYNGLKEDGDYTKDISEFQKQYFSDIKPQKKKLVGSVDFGASSLEAGNSLSQSNGEVGGEIPTIEMYTTPSGEMVGTDPVSISHKYNQLIERQKSKDSNVGQTITDIKLVPDDGDLKAAKKLKEDFPYVDMDGIYDDTKGLSDELLNKYKTDILPDRESNNELYQRKLAHVKWRKGYETSINEHLDKGFINQDEHDILLRTANKLTEATSQGDFTNQREAVRSMSKAIQLYGGENNDEILKNFAVEVSKVYGNAYNNKSEKSFTDTPESKYFDKGEQLALNFLEDVAPEKAEQYKRLMIDEASLKDKPDEKYAFDHLHQTLKETAIGLEQNSVSEELKSLNKTADAQGGLDEQQLKRADELEKKNKELADKRIELDKQYPDRVTNKVDDGMQEIFGQNLDWGDYAKYSTIRAFKNTAQGIWEAVSAPFMSDESTSMRELAIMGEGLKEEQFFHKTDKNKGVQYDKMVFDPELKAKIDAIYNDKNLDDKQKKKIIGEYLTNNPDKFGRVPIHNGKYNLNPASLLYGLTDLGTAILPFVAIEAATGGIGGAGAAAKFIRTFTAAAATTIHDEYSAALLEGKTGSDAYRSAMAKTAINSFAIAGAGTPAELRAMAKGNSSAEKLIRSMSDDAIQKQLDKGIAKGFKPLAQSLKERAKAIPSMVGKGLKAGAKFEGYMAGANAINGREVNQKQMILNVANFGILGAALGHLGYKSPTELQKSAGYEFAKNPKEYEAVAREMHKDGFLSNEELNHRITLIEQYGEAFKTLPKANAKGEPLTEIEKSNILFNIIIKNEGNKGKSNLPPKQAEKAEHSALVADHKNDLILEPKTIEKLESTKIKLENQLEKKDENGKSELTDTEIKQAKAELEAIDSAIENKSKEPKGEPENITKPIELSTTPIEVKPEIIDEKILGDKSLKQVEGVPEDYGKIGVRGADGEFWAYIKMDTPEGIKSKRVGDIHDSYDKARQQGEQIIRDQYQKENPQAQLPPPKGKDVVVDEGVGNHSKAADKIQTIRQQQSKELSELEKSHNKRLENIGVGNFKEGEFDTIFNEYNKKQKEIRSKYEGEINKLSPLVGGDSFLMKGDKDAKEGHHFTNEEALNEILNNNEISGYEKSDEGFGGVSLTTDKNLDSKGIVLEYGNSSNKNKTTNDQPIRIDFDIEKLKQDGYKTKLGNEDLGTFPNEQEVRVIKDNGNGLRNTSETTIYDAKKYIKNVQINEVVLGKEKTQKLIKQLEDNNIPYTIKEQSISTNKEINEAKKTKVPDTKEKTVITDVKPDKVEFEAEAGEGKELPKELTVGDGEGDMGGITHAANEVRRQDRELPEYEKTPESFEQWNNDAEKALKNGYNVERLFDKMEKDKYDPTPVENSIRKIYIATLDAEISKNPTDALLAKQKRFIQLGDAANSRAGRNLVSLKGEGSPMSSISDFYVAKMEASGVDKLTEQQKAETKQAFDNVQKADKNAGAAMEAYREEIAKLRAENELLKQKKSGNAKSSTPKTKEDYVSERQSLKEKLKKQLDEYKTSINKIGIKDDGVEGFVITAKMAKTVIEIVKSHVDEAGHNLKEVTKRTFEEIKDILKGISEKDVQDIIAGEYNEKKETRSDLSARMRDLKDEAYYINKLEKLLKGEEPKSEKLKIKRNQQITELQDKIKELKKEESAASKFYGEGEAAGNKRIEKLEDELERIKDRREKEKPEKGSKEEREISEAEQKLLDEIEVEQSKWDAENDAAKVAKKEYRRLETERNRQLERVDTLKKKLKSVSKGNLPQKGTRVVVKDTPEIEALKEEIKTGEKIIRSTIATQKKIREQEAELQRLKDRRDKEPSDVNKRTLTQRELDLKEQIAAERKAFNKEKSEEGKFYKEEVPDEIKKLQSILRRNEKETEKINERIKNNDFEAKKPISILEDVELQKKFPKQYRAVLDAILAKEEARHEFDIALLKDQMAKRSTVKKGIDIVGDVIGTTKSLVTGIDASGIGIQNLVAMVAHPRSAATALPASFGDFISAKSQDRWLASVHNSKEYPVSQKAGLDITEPKSLKSSEKEEIFTHNLLDRQIKFKGKTYVISKYITKPFERIFTGLGNRMRWNLWTRGVEKLYNEGYTWEKHPEEFKSLAKILNTETGRGTLHKTVDKAFDFISAGIWSPRLMASRLNILGLGDLGNLVAGGKKGYYGGLTPKMRAYAIKDLAKFIVFGATTMGLAGITFADDMDLNPNSSTFGSFLVNGKRYNIWGGFTQYVRLVAKYIRGGETTKGEFKESNPLVTTGRFLWSKTTPAVGTAIGFLHKNKDGVSTDYMGKPMTLSGSSESLLIPLSIRGIAKGVKEEGGGSLLWTGLPSFVGLNVSYESDFNNDSATEKPTKKQLPKKQMKKQTQK